MSDDDPEIEFPDTCPDGQEHWLLLKVRHGRIILYCERCHTLRWATTKWTPEDGWRWL